MQKTDQEYWEDNDSNVPYSLWCIGHWLDSDFLGKATKWLLSLSLTLLWHQKISIYFLICQQN